ncbi:MAG: hypothetical protein F2667_02100 [Actinobacteria bacterium]|uniref:Unannotated protein n=1 Tax=freshwater metagenome TaxID=449393 RepID=A0A6J6NXW8_9ZZZZ|nr:hypothetical protein [Actinomycetota bacterium]
MRARRTLGALVLGLGASLVALAAPVAAATCPDGGPCVVVEVVGSVSETRTYSAQEVVDLTDLVDAPYLLRDEAGVERSPDTRTWTSLQALVDAMAPLSHDLVTYTEVIDEQGTSLRLDEHALDDPGSNGFEDALMPAVSFSGSSGGQGGAITYLRPLRDDQDVNVSAQANRKGYFQTDAALRIVVHTSGRLLRPVVTATEVTRAGVAANTYDLTASVPDAPAGLTYDWALGDGDTSSVAAPRHTYDATDRSTYYVVLSVTGDDGSSGRSDPVAVEVSEPPPEESPGPTPGGGESEGPDTGPTDSGGAHEGGSTGGAPAEGGPTLGGLSEVETGGEPSVVTPTPDAGPGPAPVAGRQVSGTLLIGLAAGAAPSVAPEDVAPSARASSPRTALPTWLLAVAGGVLLLAAGALGESPAVRRAWRRRRDKVGT